MDALRSVLDRIGVLLNDPDLDVTWAGFDSQSEAMHEYAKLYNSAMSGELSAIRELEIWFAPTGPLQEMAMSNGWSDEYMKLASRFDEAIGSKT